MGVIFLIVFFFVSFLIVGLVLLQEGKGGGLTGMSTGMDGVMGAKNPLRKMTAWLFVLFVLLAIGINYYFHNRADTSVPTGIVLPQPEAIDFGQTESGLETPGAGESGLELPVDALRPEALPESFDNTTPADSLRPSVEAEPADAAGIVEAEPLTPPPAEPAASAEGLPAAE
ncbi:MAG: preprotein translocase subunit SecG [Planctomycetes bacterium]|nr:preprotein translocase subunit SecG [Planctomycetota bacterium]